MPQDVPPLPPDEQSRLTEVLAYWGKVHPRGHRPLFQLADGSEVTPLDIAQLVWEPDHPIARYLFRVFALATLETPEEDGVPFDVVVETFQADADRWSHGEARE